MILYKFCIQFFFQEKKIVVTALNLIYTFGDRLVLKNYNVPFKKLFFCNITPVDFTAVADDGARYWYRNKHKYEVRNLQKASSSLLYSINPMRLTTLKLISSR